MPPEQIPSESDDQEKKRLFFGIEVKARWPEELPTGRLLYDHDRHLTLAFLGTIPWPPVEALLRSIPIPSFKVGLAGIFDQCLFLPPRKPSCVSWHVSWLEKALEFEHYQKSLSNFLVERKLIANKVHDRDFLPHVTLCRPPFSFTEWRHAFHAMPMITESLHLYQSLGRSRYRPIWSHRILPPFEEIDHTADIAFRIYGESLEEIHLHAMTALAFEDPRLIPLIKRNCSSESLDEIIIALNTLIAESDQNYGSPFKAVSFHGEIVKRGDGVLTWEMIVDV